MEMTGERLVPAPRDVVWRALNDAEVLKAAIPGCLSLVKEDDTHMAAVASIKVGPISAKFSGKVELSELDPPNSYRITGEGQGGLAGFAKGGATVRLSERDGATLLQYSAEAQIGGKIAQLGARLIDSTAKQLTNVFFDRFVAAVVSPDAASARGPAAAPTSAAAQSLPGGTARAVSQPALAAPVMSYNVPAGRWHGGSLLLGVLTGSAITLIAVFVGRYLS